MPAEDSLQQFCKATPCMLQFLIFFLIHLLVLLVVDKQRQASAPNGGEQLKESFPKKNLKKFEVCVLFVDLSYAYVKPYTHFYREFCHYRRVQMINVVGHETEFSSMKADT